MKKIVLLFFILTFSLVAKESLKFEIKEKSASQIKILIKRDEKERRAETTTQKIVYIVKKGDTLTKISKAYGVSIENLIKKNKIKDKNLIIINQRLIIEK